MSLDSSRLAFGNSASVDRGETTLPNFREIWTYPDNVRTPVVERVNGEWINSDLDPIAEGHMIAVFVDEPDDFYVELFCFVNGYWYPVDVDFPKYDTFTGNSIGADSNSWQPTNYGSSKPR